MTILTATETSAHGARLADYDAIVVGSGFAGIYALHKFRNEQGLTVRAFEKGGGIGGTCTSTGTRVRRGRLDGDVQ
jgi:cyclohexanone monooxygenase